MSYYLPGGKKRKEKKSPIDKWDLILIVVLLFSFAYQLHKGGLSSLLDSFTSSFIAFSILILFIKKLYEKADLNLI